MNAKPILFKAHLRCGITDKEIIYYKVRDYNDFCKLITKVKEIKVDFKMPTVYKIFWKDLENSEISMVHDNYFLDFEALREYAAWKDISCIKIFFKIHF